MTGARCSLISAAALMGLVGCGSSPATHRRHILHPAFVRPVRWGAWQRGKRVVELTTHGLPGCAYKPLPRIKRIVKVERRRSVFMTVLVRMPPKTPGCAFLDVPLRRRVKFDRPLRNLVLYDGSTSPPTRRWPGGHIAYGSRGG